MANTLHKYVLVKGRIKNGGFPEKSVYIHEKNNSNSPCIGTAKSTEIYPYLGQEDADPHYYRIEFGDGIGFITSNTRYTEVIYKV